MTTGGGARKQAPRSAPAADHAPRATAGDGGRATAGPLAAMKRQLNATPAVRGLLQLEQTLNAPPPPAPQALSSPNGLPLQLKAGIEKLSGLSMDDVQVNYRSSEPARFNAAAYAMGNTIHLGPGQERHLPHEAWHVVQQKQDRVAPTSQFAGASINADPDLESEADVMGARATGTGGDIAARAPAPAAPLPRSAGILQAKFEQPGEGMDFIDSETGFAYRCVQRGAVAGLFERVSDGFRVWVSFATGLPIDDSPEHRAVRLSAARAPEEFLGPEKTGDADESTDMEVEEKDPEPEFEKGDWDADENPSYIAPPPGNTRSKQESQTTQLTFHVALDILHGRGRSDQRYSAADLWLDGVEMSDERPPTRFGDKQESHSVAFLLIRTALQNFAGRPLVNLLHFLRNGFAELAAETESQEDARTMARATIPTGYLDSLEEGRMPLDAWNMAVSNMLYYYETAYHLSGTAVFKNGPPGNRSEQNAGRRLGAAEAALASDETDDLDQFYQDNFAGERSKFFKGPPTPLKDAQLYLDITFSISKEEYVQSLRHWHEMLWIGYPRVMSRIDEALKASIEAKELSEGKQKEGAKTVGDWKPGFAKPDYALPNRAVDPLAIGNMRDTGQAVQVRLTPLFDLADRLADGRRPVLPEAYHLDELGIGQVQIGDSRFATAFGTAQMSHTVAWTLVRATIMGFSQQPLANLIFYLIHGFEEIGGGEANHCAADLLGLTEQALSLANWHKVAAQAVVEYLRLDQLSKNATYAKSAKGNAEGYYIQVLRQNEIHLAMEGKLWDSKDKVIAAAENLLDADLDHAGLSWENVAKAVSRWEQSLRLAFPLLMRAGGNLIVARWHDKEITTRNSPVWATLPLASGDGRAINTVSGLLHHARNEGVIGTGSIATLANPAPALGGNQRFHTQAAMGGRNNLLNAFALSLIGLIGQGVVDADAIAAKIPGLPPEVVMELVQFGQGNATPASLRAIQLLLATRLRSLSGKLGVDPKERDDTIRATVLADHFGIAIAALTPGLGNVNLALHPPRKDGEDAVPTIGLHRNDLGLWSSVRTQAGRFDLTSNALPGDAQASAWSSSLPEGVQRYLRARMYGRTKLGDPVEGTFDQGGQDYAVWRTTGDNNCSFNGMAQVVAGLVNQEQMTADGLAGRLGIPAERLQQAAEMAREARIDSRRGGQIETLLSGPLRAAAVAALRNTPDILAQMQEEFFSELRGALLLRFVGRRLPRGDLFDDQPKIAAILDEVTGVLAGTLDALCKDRTEKERETSIDAVLAKHADELRALFRSQVLPAYFEHMETDGVWAGAPELQALARLMGVRLSIFRDWGGGIFGRDEGIAASGSGPAGELTELEIEELRRQDLIEGRPMALESRIYFRHVPMEIAEARLADHADLLAKFKRLRDGGYIDAPIEVGMFRHRNRAHWSAVTTAAGSHNLQDGTNRLVGVPILAGTVDTAPSILGPTTARTQPVPRPTSTMDSKPATGMIEREFGRGSDNYRVWHTTGDNNCSFNGMAQTIAGLVAQGRMTGEHLLNSLGDRAPASLGGILENAERARQDPKAARAVEQALANPLRQVAASALAERGDLRVQMAEEFIDELRGHAYTALGVPWHRSGDLFERGNAAIRGYLKKTAGGLAQALTKDCKDKTVHQKEKLIDEGIAANLGTYIGWFNGEGMTAYLDEMRQNGVWAGAPELQALAGRLGVGLSIFRDFGQGVLTRDEGIAGAGSADASGLSDENLDRLRALEIVEGRPRGLANLVYFKRLPRERVVTLLGGDPALHDAFLRLYDAQYRFRDRAPIEIGMFRHRHPHWSAVTSSLNAYDLSDDTDRREAVSEEDMSEKMQEEKSPPNSF